MSFCFGTLGKSGGHAIGVRGGRRASPYKVQGARPSIVSGSNRSALIIIESTRGEGGEKKKDSPEIARGPASSLLVHPSPLETHCV